MSEGQGKYRKLSHVVYQCTYHVVWVPKYRFRVLKGAIKELLDENIRMLCSWKEVEVLELSVQDDRVLLVWRFSITSSIPPKGSVSEFTGFLKRKLAIKLFKTYPRMKQKPYWGNHFWARGYFVNTVGLNEDLIRRYVKYQEEQEKRREREHRDYNLFK